MDVKLKYFIKHNFTPEHYFVIIKKKNVQLGVLGTSCCT